MEDDENTTIQVSRSNKDKVDDSIRIHDKESYNNIFSELIEFAIENNFKDIRIKNLTKNLKDDINANNKIKRETVKTATIQ